MSFKSAIPKPLRNNRFCPCCAPLPQDTKRAAIRLRRRRERVEEALPSPERRAEIEGVLRRKQG